MATGTKKHNKIQSITKATGTKNKTQNCGDAKYGVAVNTTLNNYSYRHRNL